MRPSIFGPWMLGQAEQTPAPALRTMSMPTPVAPQILYVDRLETTIGTLLLIHDREGHVRALDFHDFESRMRRLLRLHYGAEGDDFAIEDRAAPPEIRHAQQLFLRRSLRDQLHSRDDRRHVLSARGLGGTQDDPSRNDGELWGAGASAGAPEICPCCWLGQRREPGCHCGSVPPRHRY